MALWAKWWLCTYENLNLNLQHPGIPGCTVHICKPKAPPGRWETDGRMESHHAKQVQQGTRDPVSDELKMSAVTGLFSVTRVLWGTHTHTHDNSRKRIPWTKIEVQERAWCGNKGSQENELLRAIGLSAMAAHRRPSELGPGGLLQKAVFDYSECAYGAQCLSTGNANQRDGYKVATFTTRLITVLTKMGLLGRGAVWETIMALLNGH